MPSVPSAEERGHGMATATPPRSVGTPPLQHYHDDREPSQPAKTRTGAAGCSANGQDADRPCTLGNEDENSPCSGAVSFCSGDKAEDLRCRAHRSSKWKRSTSTDAGMREEEASCPAVVSSVSSYCSRPHPVLTGLTHERTAEQSFIENRYNTSVFQPASCQTRERAGDTAEPSSRPLILAGATSPSVVQTTGRIGCARAAAVAASSRTMLSTEVGDPYHALSSPTAGTLYSTLRAGSDQDGADVASNFTVQPSQQDIYYMDNSTLMMSANAPANLSMHPQRNSIASRDGSASVAFSRDRGLVPGIWELDEWMLTSRPETMTTLSGNVISTVAPSTDYEGVSAQFPRPVAFDVATELLSQPSPIMDVCVSHAVPSPTVSNELQAGTITTANANRVPSAKDAQLPRVAASNGASTGTKERPPVLVYKKAAATAPPPPLDTSANPHVCFTTEDSTAGLRNRTKHVMNDSTVTDAAGYRHCVSDSGTPFPEASSLVTAHKATQKSPLRPPYASNTTNIVSCARHAVTSDTSNGSMGVHRPPSMTTAPVSMSAEVLAPANDALLDSGVHPICSGVDGLSCGAAAAASVASTAAPLLLSPQSLATAGKPTSTVWTTHLPEVPRVRTNDKGNGSSTLPPLPENNDIESPSGVPHRAVHCSAATTVAGATLSTANTFSDDPILGCSPKNVSAHSGNLEMPSLGPQPHSCSNGENFLILSGDVEQPTHPSQAAPSAPKKSLLDTGNEGTSDVHAETSNLLTSAPTALASGTAHRVSLTFSSPLGTVRKPTRPQEESHGDEVAPPGDGRKNAAGPTRSAFDWRRRIGFKDNREIVLPDSKSLRVSMSSWVEFRSPTMREQGKEMMPSTEEVYTHLITRWNSLCVLVVVDEDAVQKPCLVVSGLSVRVFEEDSSVALANNRMDHSMMRDLKRRGGATRSHFLHSTGYEDDDNDASVVSFRGGVGLSNRATSSSGGGLPSNQKLFVLLPDKKVRRSRSGDENSTDPCSGEFDNYLRNFDVDETLSRLAGRKECDSVALEQLMRTWVTGHNTCLLLGNGNGRSTQSLDIAVGAVESAMSMVRERLNDRTSCVELHISMSEVADDEENGGTIVRDLLASSSDDDAEDNCDDDELEKDARGWRKEASRVSQKGGASRLPAQLARSPLLGTFVKGLRSVRIDDATTAKGAIGRALTLGFMRFNISTHSSRNNSMSNLSTISSPMQSKVHISFATLQLKTICRGSDMRSAQLSASESATGRKKFGGRKRRSHSVEYQADVLVSSLLLVFFDTKYMVLDTLVQRCQAYHTTSREEDEGIVHPNAPLRHQKPTFQPTSWPNAVSFLESLLCDALGGRTRTMACLCLSEYDSRATLWLQVLSRARRITNVTPNCGNMRNYLLYLMEQYDNLAALQNRRKQDARLFLPVLNTDGTAKNTRGGRFSTVPSRKEFDQWSVACIKKMITELNAFLATPAGETPTLEQLEISNETMIAKQSDPLSSNPLTFFLRYS
ncbi:hypothetical protein, unknown function [Leishmania tarentolae]|uniref:Uncharacterized protein n=1 Tax=Leishmania tarentolae TaxID=5689 RepID=A0A640KSQ6_LEITA|nr:hypothetical protein, unknown function [Leishmania tarentolae]